MTVNADVAKLLILEASLVVLGVVMSERHVIVAASPSDFGVGEGVVFFLSQRG